MWRFVQRTGEMFDPDAHCVSVGYSGHSYCRNVPTMQSVHDAGPIPCGIYTVGQPFDSPDHGPFVLPLTPSPANQMFGRAGFLVHGDAVKAPGTASKGCIIQPRSTRERMARSDDNQLEVVSGLDAFPDVDGEISV